MSIADMFKPNVNRMKEKKDVEGLMTALADKKYSDIRRQAAEALGELHDPRGISPLIAALKDDAGEVRREAAKALESLADLGITDPLIGALKDDNRWARMWAAEIFRRIEDKRAVEPLKELFYRDKDGEVQRWVADALAMLDWAPETDHQKAYFHAVRVRWYEVAEILKRTRDAEIVKMLKPLVRKGKTDDAFFNLFFDSVKNGHLEELKYLVETFDIKVKKIEDSGGRTLLHLAAQNNQIGIVKYLLEKGVKAKHRDGREMTAADYAYHRGFTEILDILCPDRPREDAQAGLKQADHYIIRKDPPAPFHRDLFIYQVLTANGYAQGDASVDFKVATDINEVYMYGLARVFADKTGFPIDDDKSAMHSFSGAATGMMIAIFKK